METCKIENCNRAVKARGVCGTHYQELRLSEQPECAVSDCDKKAYAKSLCIKHYNHMRATGDPLLTRMDVRVTKRLANISKCAEDGCDALETNRGMCFKHFVKWTYTDEGRAAVQFKPKKTKVAYITAHHRLRRLKGYAADFACVDCGEEASEWSLNHDAKETIASVERAYYGTLYSLNAEDYSPRCTACHRAYDARHGLKRKKPVIDASGFNTRPETMIKAKEASAKIKAGATATKVADEMGVSVGCVTRWFIAAEGMSVSQWRKANKAVAA